MSGPYIVVSSITYAYKGKNILEKKGCKAYIEREPKELSSCGCHYCLRIRNFPLEKAVEILNAAHVKVIRTGSGGNDLS